MRKRVNDRLDPSHQLDEAAFNAICLDLDQNPVTDDPKIISGEKQRDDGNFDRVVEEAFKVRLPPKFSAFRHALCILLREVRSIFPTRA